MPVVDEDTTVLDETLLDDMVPCDQPGCENPVIVRVSMRCCGQSGFLCDPHLTLARSTIIPGPAICRYCRAEVGYRAGYDEIVRVVPV